MSGEKGPSVEELLKEGGVISKDLSKEEEVLVEENIEQLGLVVGEEVKALEDDTQDIETSKVGNIEYQRATIGSEMKIDSGTGRIKPEGDATLGIEIRQLTQKGSTRDKLHVVQSSDGEI